MIPDNYVSLEELKQFVEHYNNQEGCKYPCSNQIVRCGVITDNREKAIDYMKDYIKDKNIVKKYERRDGIEWFLDNGEIWIWRIWNESCRGYRLYKLAIDRYTDKEVFETLVAPKCAHYCCSVEII